MEWGYLALFALLPWSLECSFGTWKINLPSEPIIAILGMGMGWRILRNPGGIWAVFSNCFLLKISAAWIGWLAISACFSTMSLVSWKYWAVEAGHWWVFCVGLAFFPKLWPQVFRVFAFSMMGMVVYTLIHHSFYHFRVDQALLAPMPFFPENTLYAAVVAMVVFLIPPRSTPPPAPPLKRRGDVEYTATMSPGVGLNGGVLGLFLTGLFFSFCRAAWVSVVLAGGLFLLVHFRKKWRLFAFAGLALLVGGLLFSGQIVDRMAKEIGKDVSTLERLNRFACAWRMAHDRPWPGFGPGTFQFQYISFQKPEEMTRISARAPILACNPDTYGRGGGAHSEYFQALAEDGWPGLVLWLALTLAVLWTGFNSFFRAKTTDYQLFALALTLSLLTFFLHGLANNMLHDGRVAALVWGMVAVLSSEFEVRSSGHNGTSNSKLRTPN